MPHTLVSDNVAKFADKDLCAWLQYIGCQSIKTPPYHPQSNSLAECMVQTIKCGLKAINKSTSNFGSYLACMLLSY